VEEFRSNHRRRRRAASAPIVLVTLPVLIGFTAPTVDVGAWYNTRADLPIVADAAAWSAVTSTGWMTLDSAFTGLAASVDLGTYSGYNVIYRATAIRIAQVIYVMLQGMESERGPWFHAIICTEPGVRTFPSAQSLDGAPPRTFSPGEHEREGGVRRDVCGSACVRGEGRQNRGVKT
jgi:hypothetical protein